MLNAIDIIENTNAIAWAKPQFPSGRKRRWLLDRLAVPRLVVRFIHQLLIQSLLDERMILALDDDEMFDDFRRKAQLKFVGIWHSSEL